MDYSQAQPLAFSEPFYDNGPIGTYMQGTDLYRQIHGPQFDLPPHFAPRVPFNRHCGHPPRTQHLQRPPHLPRFAPVLSKLCLDMPTMRNTLPAVPSVPSSMPSTPVSSRPTSASSNLPGRGHGTLKHSVAVTSAPQPACLTPRASPEPATKPTELKLEKDKIKHEAWDPNPATPPPSSSSSSINSPVSPAQRLQTNPMLSGLDIWGGVDVTESCKVDPQDAHLTWFQAPPSPSALPVSVLPQIEKPPLTVDTTGVLPSGQSAQSDDAEFCEVPHIVDPRDLNKGVEFKTEKPRFSPVGHFSGEVPSPIPLAPDVNIFSPSLPLSPSLAFGDYYSSQVTDLPPLVPSAYDISLANAFVPELMPSSEESALFKPVQRGQLHHDHQPANRSRSSSPDDVLGGHLTLPGEDDSEDSLAVDDDPVFSPEGVARFWEPKPKRQRTISPPSPPPLTMDVAADAQSAGGNTTEQDNGSYASINSAGYANPASNDQETAVNTPTDGQSAEGFASANNGSGNGLGSGNQSDGGSGSDGAPTSRRGRKQSLTDDPSKTFVCDLCHRRFRRQEHLKRHYRSLHTADKPFECADCGKKFSRSDNLAQHARTHGAGAIALSLIEDSDQQMAAHAAAFSAAAAGHPHAHMAYMQHHPQMMMMAQQPPQAMPGLSPTAEEIQGYGQVLFQITSEIPGSSSSSNSSDSDSSDSDSGSKKRKERPE